ncbi:sulfite exporter TauE/SafE family protein [soil metagenome]
MRKRRIAGMTPRRFLGTVVLPIGGISVILAVLVVAPPEQRVMIVLASVVAMASGLAATSIGVYGGVLVPGLLLLGVDPRFAAAASLFLQVLVIPLGAGAHYRLGNVSRKIAMPLVLGGMAGAFTGPFFAALLPSEVIARLVAGMIVLVGLVVLATLKWGGLGAVREPWDIPTRKVAAVGLTAGFSSGISGAGWGPIGVKLLILLRIEPKAAIGSSLVGRVFMAGAAVVGYLVAATALVDVHPDFGLLLVLFCGSVAAMVPGAFLLSRLGRETATVFITLLSITLAIPTLIWG